ncbi:DUF4124 domain-containing protein [Halothiobacillus sp.]|uniref:DUF4124 domain-containing protein n=1 Tax=Halothiobacillus sp. TaxID=1891311 RepID=UPI002616A6AD|nr:DUF4124 domain-containing protein [Halothiobacillus sp.]MDD4966495.1 DUF4124 domain-containing protein [Halothiobacillus sp.]
MLYKSVFIFLIGIAAAHADIYKCKDANGQITFSQLPCGGVEQQNITGSVKSEMPSVRQIGTQDDDDYLKRYSGPVDFSDSSDYGNFSKAAAIISVASQKGRDCEWAIKVDHKYNKCQDFIAFTVEGNRFSQAVNYLKTLTKNNSGDISASDWNSVNYDMKNVIKYKNFAIQSFSSGR